MKLTFRHKNFCSRYLDDGNATQSYLKAFTTKKDHSATVAASKLLTRPEIIEYLEFLKQEKAEIARMAKERAIEELKGKILDTLEIDVWHSQVLRGQIEVEDIVPVREWIVDTPKGNKLPDPAKGRWQTVFKKITRKPNLREKQVSAAELYRRYGAYPATTTKTQFIGNGDADETPKDKSIERVVILSDGTKIPL